MSRMTINDRPVEFNLDPRTPLLFALREAANLTGTKSCGAINCNAGACMVLVDGVALKSCRITLAEAEGRFVTTIEGLNKYLGTWLLASREVVDRVDRIDSRYLGRFLLGGKSKSVTVFELLPPGELSANRHRLLTELFPEGLQLFDQRRWQQAAAVFEQACTLDGDDGPSQFYLRRCALYQQDSPPDDWQGVIRLEK